MTGSFVGQALFFVLICLHHSDFFFAISDLTSWFLFSCDTANDFRLRCDVIDLYNALWGRVTPACVPAHGVSFLFILC